MISAGGRVGVLVGVGVSEGVGVSDAVGVALGVGVSEGNGVSVGRGVVVGVSVAVGAGVSVGGTEDGVGVGVEGGAEAHAETRNPAVTRINPAAWACFDARFIRTIQSQPLA